MIAPTPRAQKTPREGRFFVEAPQNLFYALLMRAFPSVGILLLPLLATAGVYKWEGPDGRVYYSDRPASGAKPIGVPVNRGKDARKEEPPVEETAAVLGPYDSFEILVPEPNQTLRDAQGEVDLSLLVEPPLAGDHRLLILLNGQPLEGDTRRTQVRLQGLTFGSHRVQAQIQNELDETIASSAPVDFHLRKALPEELRP